MDLILSYFNDLTENQIKQLQRLQTLYEDWNKKINVISRKDMEHFYERHVLHSLSIATQFNFPAGHMVMDLGCGGGFPGIPLAILFPDAHFHLVDSIQKKLKVVQDVAENLGLANVSTEHIRAEEIRNRKFDVVLSRAVAPLQTLWQWSLPLLTLKKYPANTASGLICLKGGDLNEEILACKAEVRMWNLEEQFTELWFVQKHLLQVAAHR